ncbi:unnamed protein product [Paramecium sonneborni]|uniref:SCP2 domain-containing protein n=1 Tax=Paramecium sonneborni TaxID=65129 RepID=A0A8S1JV29_9CILI|nr:unnamed protein product [Paramecium sonneborni]
MNPFIKNQRIRIEMVKKIKAIYFFKISKFEYLILNIQLLYEEQRVGTAKAIFTMVDDDIIEMTQRKLNPQQGFIQGLIKIQ